MLINRLIGVVVLGLVAALAVGCGSDSDETTGSLTKTQFIERGDKICQEALDRREATFRKLLAENANKPPLNQAEREEVVIKFAITPIEQMTEELAALGLPEGAEDQAEEMVASFESAVEDIKSDPAAALEGAGREFVEPKEQAAAFGFKSCSKI